ncbi:hypothetical protein ACJ41O_002522 [Fusarium nematophilum]
MSLPEAPSSLDDACAVIHGNTLYVYTQGAFLALPLEEGAEWETLEINEKVSGAVCVGTDAGIFVVGGTGGSAEYTGLQKYTYSDRTWTTVPLVSTFFKDRQNHGSTYIKATDELLVFGGSQDGSQAATDDTWTIMASEPYDVEGHAPSGHASLKPVLLSWSDADACMIGREAGNNNVQLFNRNTGWRASGTTLNEPLSASMQAVIMPGDDGSKSLYVFDLSKSPNGVSRYIIQNASGAPLANSAPVANEKRDLSLDDWPEYNSTLAPTAVRSNFAVAQDSDGKVVFVGGNEQEPLAIFDGGENSWLNATKVFVKEEQQKLLSDTTTSETSATETSTSTKSSTKSRTKTKSVTTEIESSTFSTAAATQTDTASASWTISETTTASATDIAPVGGSTSSGDSSSGISSNAILGITLGSILGFLAVLILVLLLLRRRKKARQASPETAQPRHNFPPDEKDPRGFGNGPLSPNSGYFRGHNPQMSQESYSSMAILMGRAGKNKTSLTRKPSHDTTRSSVSTLHKQLKATISKPILQDMRHPALQGQDTRGVAFDPTVAEPRPRNGPLETQDGLRRSSGWNRYWSGGSALQILGFGGKRNTVTSDSESHYSDSTAHRNPRVTQDSATVPPLNFDFRPEMNRVNSGSPVVAEYSKIPFRDGVVGKIERPSSKASSGYSSGIPESVNEAWDPDYKAKPWGADRAPSSVYNPSFYFGTPLSPSIPPPPRNPPSGVSTQPQLAMASTSSDMSWLNLGDRSRV